MKITKEFLVANHFKAFGEWWELNNLHKNCYHIDNYIYVSVLHEKIEIGGSAHEDCIELKIPFTQESLTKFLSSYK